MKISLYVSSSKCWWAYLAIRSNPSLFSSGEMGGASRAILFDDLARLPSNELGAVPARYFYICWDGVSGESRIDEVRGSLGEELTILAVGDSSLASRGEYRVRDLYPEGKLRFTGARPWFDLRSAAILGVCGMKALLMPLKNLAQQRGDLASGVSLLAGRKRIVFCGSYGTIPKVIGELCRRHSVDVTLFGGYRYYCDEPRPGFETYLECLGSDGEFLAGLYDEGKINGKFFLSAIHLLGREYFIEKIRSDGLDLFAHGYGAGRNINVYGTPFYAQHVFIDFGSAAGKGNYPRLADLRYFGKTVIELEIDCDLESTLEMARSGRLDWQFEREWERKTPRLMDAMR